MKTPTLHRVLVVLITVLTTLSMGAQRPFQEAFKKNVRPAVERLRLEFGDNQGNRSHLPVVIIKGLKEGPVFTVVAGVHGFEYPPIVATQALLQEIDPNALTGTIVVLPVASTNSFYTRTPFKNSNDGVNLNNAFPGDAKGSVTQKIAHMIRTEIIPVSDVFLDIHGGDANEDLLPFICYYNNEQKPEQTQLAKELSEVSGFEYIVSYAYTLKDSDPAKYVFKQATQDGKTALSIESGKLGNVQQEAVDLVKNGVYNMLHKMGMYAKATEAKDNPVRLNRQTYIGSSHDGIFYSDYKAGDTVQEGAVVGKVTDEFGAELSEIKAPKSGVILYKIGTPPVSVDDTIMCISYYE